MVMNDIDMDVAPSISTEQYPRLVFIVTDLKFSLQPNERGTIYHSSPCIDLIREQKLSVKILKDLIFFLSVNQVPVRVG